MYVQLIKDVALLVALGGLHSILARLRLRGGIWPRLLSGLLFGGVAVVGMAMPLRLQPGIIYDGRSIVLALSGLFGGRIATLAAVVIAGAYRAALGGAGVWAGLASIVGPALLGLAFRRACGDRPDRLGVHVLLALGVAAHLVMLACQLLLVPWPAGIAVIGRIWLPVMAVFPAATVLLALLLQTEERWALAEAAQRESESRYRTLFEELPVAIRHEDFSGVKARFDELRRAGVTDLRAWLGTRSEEVAALAARVRVLEENRCGKQLFGGEGPQALPRDASEYLPGAAYALFAEEMAVLFEGRRSFHTEFTKVNVRGERIHLDLTLSVPEAHAADLASVMVCFVDVTERRRTEERLRQALKMETVGRLAGGVAHDFNNMLQVILGSLELALEGAAPGGSLEQNLREARQAAQRSADLTGQLLAFARRQTVSPRVVDLNEVVTQSRRMVQRLIGEDVEFAWKPGEGAGRVLIDPAQVDQVLANLAVNARDAIGGAGRLTVETARVSLDEAWCARHPGSEPGEFVRLAVSDDGRGMDRETMSHLFEPFFTTKGPGRGTGLGLATVYGIVKQNRGFIEVESAPGAGSAFHVYLPRVHGEEDSAQPVTPAEGPPPGGAETILVVEDEAAILQLARISLEGLGYSVLAATTPEEALEIAGKSGAIDLLVTDVVLPRMNGRELCERLRASRPGLRCLFVSGYGADVIAHRGVLEDGVRLLPKPFTLAVLAREVRDALDGAREA